MSNNSSIIKAYKGFNKDMTCRGFQYKKGRKYEINKKFINSGIYYFSAYPEPLEVFNLWHDLDHCVFHEVKLCGDYIEKEKYGRGFHSNKIRICKRLDPINDILEPNLDYNTPIVEKGNLLKKYIVRTNTIDKPKNIVITSCNWFAKGVIDSYLILYDSSPYVRDPKSIAIKVDGERIKENCCYRYKNGNIEEWNGKTNE